MEHHQDALYHISSEDILRRLLPDVRDMDLYCFESVDSTNDEAKRRFRDGLRRTSFFVADSQTHGRGRRGREFYSPAYTGLYMSLLKPLTGGLPDVLSFTSRAAVAVCRALKNVYSVTPGIKWVNDILLNGRKICGILAELVTDPRSGEAAVVIGIGINLSTENFPETISRIAGSVGNATVPREEIAAAVARELLSLLHSPDSDYLGEYRALSAVLGHMITYERNGHIRTGTAVDIDSDAALVVLCSDGTTDVLNSGEITVRPL